jgi:molybdopterin molybdotransferase
MFDIGFEEALDLVRKNILALNPEAVFSTELVGRICATDLNAAIDYPSADSSVKDGYAICSQDVDQASSSKPVTLKLLGAIGAGDSCNLTVSRRTAVRVLSGAPIPAGADAVLAEEFAERGPGEVRALANAEPGRNILTKASEIKKGELLVREREVLTPAKVSLVVAGGLDRVSVFRRPVVGLLATGSEILLPGSPIQAGKLFASNLSLQSAWLRSWSLESKVSQTGDSFDDLTAMVESMLSECDVLLTSGGAWKGDRDLTVKALDRLGWRQVFHRVRMGPGKAVAMGFLKGKPIFCLPGGPPSNESAFLLIAFPGVLQMAGYTGSPYLNLTGVLQKDVAGQKDWTQVFHCRVKKDGHVRRLIPLDSKRRLSSMARADGLFLLREGIEFIPSGTLVQYFSLTD